MRSNPGCAAGLWEVADPTLSTHTSGAPCPTHTRAPARAHTSDIPIVPHVTRGPNVPTLHTRSRTRAPTHTQNTHSHFPTPFRPPPASPLRHSLTVTHLHSFTDTHIPPHMPTTDTFINRARRSTHAPPHLAYSFRSPESFLPPPGAPHISMCRPPGGPWEFFGSPLHLGPPWSSPRDPFPSVHSLTLCVDFSCVSEVRGEEGLEGCHSPSVSGGGISFS